jgi:hypothetical protein
MQLSAITSNLTNCETDTLIFYVFVTSQLDLAFLCWFTGYLCNLFDTFSPTKTYCSLCVSITSKEEQISVKSTIKRTIVMQLRTTLQEIQQLQRHILTTKKYGPFLRDPRNFCFRNITAVFQDMSRIKTAENIFLKRVN